MNRAPPHGLLPLALVLATVVLQLVIALILDIAADGDLRLDLMAAAAILAAVALNGVRFVIWGYAHRRYPLSHTYPLTALFFPLVLALSHWRGEEIAIPQIGGTVLISVGIALMTLGSGKGEVP